MTSAREASAEAVIDGYQDLLERSERMLALAREADWSALVEQETGYVQQVARVAELDAQHALSDGERQRKAELLEAILGNDMEVRRHLVQRRDELGELIGTAQRRRDLQQAYGDGGRGAGSGRVLSAASRFGQGAS
ncbi:flagellar protein FliT [Halomonas sp. SL1]|uniref:flagellar protein FliT n=1 Tax=Halomonas sp. SL1 TaxID=2137478 RepID=UPI000D16E4B2|nr:flagellar protein FliT [Halomonas sp. SL1]RAH36595.1 flagellar protein FliT [Halomonas sp. SL1]